MKRIIRNKKGSITDISYILVGTFFVAMIFLFIALIVTNINTKIQDSTMDIMNSDAKAASNKMATGMTNQMDGMVVLFFFGLCFVSIVLAMLIPVHPAFFIFYILELLLLIMIGGGIANTYQAVIENSVIVDSGLDQKLLMTTFLFRYFPFIIGIIGFLLAIIMYKTFRSNP